MFEEESFNSSFGIFLAEFIIVMAQKRINAIKGCSFPNENNDRLWNVTE